jgi:hypothetical protein
VFDMLACPIVAALLASGSGKLAAAASIPVAHVRGATSDVQFLVDETARRSSTVRELLARLAATDAIVYVEITPSPQIPRARTKLVTAVAGARFMRIGINSGVASGDRGPLLAHELQHAVEIAERNGIRNDGSVRELYLRIGRRQGADAFETDAARDVEWTVRSELRLKIGG